MKSTKYEIEQQIDSFPVLPVTVARVMEVTGNPESSAQDLMKAMLPDQSLCLTVLKFANSVLFGRPKKVDSLKLAIAILGFNEVQSIALSKAVINSFSELSKRHKTVVDRFWEHSFLCGMMARKIAVDIELPPDTAFMAGLLHDIGKLIMLQTFMEDYVANLWMGQISNKERLHDELQQFSFTHDVIGGQLLKKWFFPDTLITAVAFHHRPEEALAEEAFALIVQLSDLLCYYSCTQSALGEDTIVTLLNTNLPDLRRQWEKLGLAWDHNSLIAWFDWLQVNHVQAKGLLNVFSA